MPGIDPKQTAVITREVRYAKPDPDLLVAAAERLGASISVVVGDGGWDVLAATRVPRARVGLLSDGDGSDELRKAGALRVHEDPADRLRPFDEVGGRP